MRVAICGPHGAGKTYLSKAVSKVTGLPLITEVARTIAADMGFSSTEQIQKSDIHTITLYQTRVFNTQIMKEDEYAEFISDRSILDCVIYMKLHGMMEDTIHDFADLAIKHCQQYDLMFYTPVTEGNLEDDGFRLTDRQSQHAFDVLMRHILKQVKGTKIIYLGPVRDNWKIEVLHHIGTYHE